MSQTNHIEPVVLKFGGTSMGSAETIADNVLPIVQRATVDFDHAYVVVSAMTGITNLLIAAAQVAVRSQAEPTEELGLIRARHEQVIDVITTSTAWRDRATRFLDSELKKLGNLLSAITVIGELSPRSRDAVIAVGERLSAYLFASLLNDRGIQAEYIETEALIPESLKYTSDLYWDRVEEIFAERLDRLPAKVVPVIPGFFGRVCGGILESVGRGYSDYCASLVGSAVKAREVQIWTDVDGVLSGNPKIVAGTVLVPHISFDEMAELANFGAKVLHPFSVRPAVKADIPIRILNTFNPTCAGTRIDSKGTAVEHPFKSITYKPSVTVVRITTPRMLHAHGFLARIGTILERHSASIDLIATSEVSISLSFDGAVSAPPALIEDLRTLGSVSVDRNLSVISIVGSEFVSNELTVHRIFATLAQGKIPVKLVSYGNALINLSLVVDDDLCERAVGLLHGEFFT